MSQCSFCKSTISGYTDNHWETLYEGVKLCKTCIERIARDMIERGEGHFVHQELKQELKDQDTP